MLLLRCRFLALLSITGALPVFAQEVGVDGSNAAESSSQGSPADEEKPLEVSKTKTKAPSPQPTPPAMLSHRVNGRLSLGSAIGIASIKPLGGSWSGGGFASVTSEWRLLPKSESWLLSARYTPYAGTLNIEGDYYDATIHGIFLGGKWAKSNLLGASTFKVGVDVGYLLIYSKPQGGYESTRSSKEGKVSVGTSTELVWKTMEKMQVGPFLAASFGNIQMIQGGALALFLF